MSLSAPGATPVNEDISAAVADQRAGFFQSNVRDKYIAALTQLLAVSDRTALTSASARALPSHHLTEHIATGHIVPI